MKEIFTSQYYNFKNNDNTKIKKYNQNYYYNDHEEYEYDGELESMARPFMKKEIKRTSKKDEIQYYNNNNKELRVTRKDSFNNDNNMEKKKIIQRRGRSRSCKRRPASMIRSLSKSMHYCNNKKEKINKNVNL